MWKCSIIIIWFFISFVESLYCQSLPLDSLFSIARQHIYKGNYTTAVSLYQECLLQSQQQKNWFKVGNAFVGIGVAHDKSGNYQEALQQYFQAAQAYEKAGNGEKQAGTFLNIGNVYRVIKSFDKAHAFFELAYQIRQQKRDSTGLAKVVNDMGILFMDRDSTHQAIVNFKKVIHTYDRYATKELHAYALNNLAICYSKLSDYNASDAYYTASLNLMQQLKNRFGVALVFINLCDLYNKQNQYNKAIRYGTEGIALAQELGSKELLVDGYKRLAYSYSQLNNYKQAHHFLSLQQTVKDSIFRDETARSYAAMEARFQNERKAKEILLLQQEATIRNAALAEQQRTRYFLLVVLGLVAVVAILLYRSAILKQRSNKSLALLNTKLEEANHSKTKLLSILNHDLRAPVSNLFSFLHLKAENSAGLSEAAQQEHDQKITNAAEQLLDAMEDLLVWSKSQMEHFAPAVETVYIAPLFDEIITLHATAAANKNMALLKSCPPHLRIHTDPNFLKIILRNLTSNAIKFTPHHGTVTLEAFEQNGSLNLIVKDNGPGISFADQQTLFEWNSIRSDSSGLGLKLAKEFAEKLNGSITVQSQPGSGTAFILAFSPVTKGKVQV